MLDPLVTMQSFAQSFAYRGEGLATMKDVAKRARVSVSTVSHVLNGTRVVSETTHERVLSAIEELGYQESLLAKSLRTQRTFNIGLLISDIQNPFFTSVVRGVEDVALGRGYHVFLCNTDEEPCREEEYITELTKKGVDGLIVAPAGPRQACPQGLQARSVPLVFMDREVEGVETDAIRVDNFLGMRMASNHLASLGHRRIGMISGPLEKASGYERFRGFEEALSGLGLELDDSLIKFGDFKTTSGRQATAELLRVSAPPTALIVANNQMTLGALLAIRELNLSIPGDISVIGFDDMEWAPLANPPLTTIAQPTYEMGSRSAQMLLDKVEGGPDGQPTKVLLKPALIVRDSTAPPVDAPSRAES
jgi:LacI family transcriptional regulator